MISGRKKRASLHVINVGQFKQTYGRYYFLLVIEHVYKRSNPKCFCKWDRGFGSKPDSFNYKEIIYYVISYSKP